MDSLGQYLAELRNQASLSLEAVQKDIRLTQTQLDDIEANRLTNLGDHGMARAICYSYARYLSADEKTAMYLFDQAWPVQKKEHFTPKTPIREKTYLISINQIWILAISLFVLLLAGITYLSYQKGYLTRPFQKTVAAKPESLATPKVMESKPDTMRARLLQYTDLSTKNTPTAKSPKPKKKVKLTAVYADSTDYLNKLLFGSKSSPFNQ